MKPALTPPPKRRARTAPGAPPTPRSTPSSDPATSTSLDSVVPPAKALNF
jgi:hypothetical protein